MADITYVIKKVMVTDKTKKGLIVNLDGYSREILLSKNLKVENFAKGQFIEIEIEDKKANKAKAKSLK